MKTHIVLLTITTTLAACALAADTGATVNHGDAVAAFARLKSLVGEWNADSQMGKIHLSYELSSGGNVLLEHMRADAMHEEMITTYYLEGDQLALTHYCKLGNNPHMIARKIDLNGGEIDFDFAGPANLASDQAQHMHTAAFRFVDADHFNNAWTMFEDAKPKMTIAAQYTRSK